MCNSGTAFLAKYNEMPRQMRFKLTRDQILNRTQTVTRRTGWTFLKTDDIVDAYVNDLRRTGEVFTGLFVFGEQIRVVSVRTEPLSRMEQTEYGDREAKLEGFPHMTGAEFVTMYCKAQGGQPSQEVTRIEFEYFD